MGVKTTTLVVEITNVDDDIAESAFIRTVNAMAKMNHIRVDAKSRHVEPHDDTRGIFASIDIDGGLSTSAQKLAVLRAFNSLLSLDLCENSKAKINVKYAQPNGGE
jgi:hypothetical protein